MRILHRDLNGDRGRAQSGWMRVVAVALIVTFIVAAASAGSAQEGIGTSQHQSPSPTQFGYGAVSLLLTIPYGLAKVAYAGLGGIVDGFAFALSKGDSDAAKAVWTASLRGTYVLTPKHLTGQEPIHFMGVPDQEEPIQQARSLESYQ